MAIEGAVIGGLAKAAAGLLKNRQSNSRSQPSQGGGPTPPPMPQSTPYRSPKPIYSEADYKRAMDQDFNYARQAAGIARDNQIAVEGNRIRQTGAANVAAINAQGRNQKNLVNAQIQGQSKLANQNFGYQQQLGAQNFGYQSSLLGQQGKIQSNLLGQQGKIQSSLQAGNFAGMAGLQNNQARLNQQSVDRNFNRQFNAAIEAAGRVDNRAFKTAPHAGNPSASMASQLSARSYSSGGVNMNANAILGAKINQMADAVGYANKLKLAYQQSDAIDGNGGGYGGGSDPAAVAAALARDQLAAQERMQNANIQAQDRDRGERLASAERMQQASIASAERMPQIQSNAEEDLRKKARQAALSVFNTARPGMTPTSLRPQAA